MQAFFSSLICHVQGCCGAQEWDLNHKAKAREEGGILSDVEEDKSKGLDLQDSCSYGRDTG